MAQDITLMGASYSDVPAVTLPKTGGGTASFTDVSDTTASASDVASGKYFYTAAGTRTRGTNSGGGGGGGDNTFVVTLSYDSQTDIWSPDCTHQEIMGATYEGKNIAWKPDGQYFSYYTAANGAKEGIDFYYVVTDTDWHSRRWDFILDSNNEITLDGTWELIIPYFETVTKTYTPTESAQTETITFDNNYYNGLQEVDVTVNPISSTYVGSGITRRSSSDLTVSGTTVSVPSGYYSSNASISVPSGKAFYTYTGLASRTANSYGATNATVTVTKAGTYTISYVAVRGSSSGTMGTNLHIGSTSGTNNTTWNNGTYGQSVTLTGQSISANTAVTIYATSGSNSRAIHVGQLIVKEE